MAQYRLDQGSGKTVADDAPLPVKMASGGGVTASATFTPAAAAYSANDTMDVAQALAFGANTDGAAYELLISATKLTVSHTAIISGETSYDLHLYSVTPPSAPADNAAWDLPSGDRASYLGKISLGAPADVGSSLLVEQAGNIKQITVPASGTVYALLVTVGAFTATAAARSVVVKGVRV